MLNYKKPVFDDILSKQISLTAEMLSRKNPDALAAVEALEGIVIGYADSDYDKEKASLTKKLDEDTKPLEDSLKEQFMNKIEALQKRQPFEQKYAMQLFSQLNRMMVRQGIHPARSGVGEHNEEDWAQFEKEVAESKGESVEDASG